MRAVLLLLATVLAAGCLDQLRGDLEAEPVPAFSAVMPWRLDECQYAIAIVPADPAAFADRVPEGFRVLAVNEIPGLPAREEPRARGNLGIETFACAGGSGVNETANLTDVQYGSVFTFVEPPAALRDPNATYHFVKFEVLVPDAERQALLVAEDIPAMNGTAVFSRYQDVGPASVVQSRLALLNDTYDLEAASGAPMEALASISFVEFSVGEHGFTIWHANVTSSAVTGGVGQLLVGEESWVADVVGTRVQAYYLAGRGSLTEGSIKIPGYE